MLPTIRPAREPLATLRSSGRSSAERIAVRVYPPMAMERRRWGSSASAPPITLVMPDKASARPSMTPNAAAGAASTEPRKLGSSAVGISCPMSASRLANPMPRTPGVNHGRVASTLSVASWSLVGVSPASAPGGSTSSGLMARRCEWPWLHHCHQGLAAQTWPLSGHAHLDTAASGRDSGTDHGGLGHR